MKHLHLDSIGGVAGDMFIAALLDAFQNQVEGAIAAAEQVAHVRCRVLRHHDHMFTGTRFLVEQLETPRGP